jgi:membrane protease YdiL (CAAX protease family)
LSSRDLPVWARAATAALVIVGGALSSRSEVLREFLGNSALEVSAGVISVSVLLGMRLPFDLWPRAAQRERFSLVMSLAVALALGALILVAGPLPGAFLEQGQYGVVLGIVVGGVVWALGWGRTQQTVFGRWYGLAALCATVPVAVSIVGVILTGETLPEIDGGEFLRGTAFFAVAGAAGALVTQELAFRRLLIGQSGDAGLVAVIGAALAFAIWHVVDPAETQLVKALATGTVDGIVIGSLYLLSRSLLVPAFFHGLSNGLQRGVFLGMDDPSALLGPMEVIHTATVVVLAAILAYLVWRRSGVMGTLRLRESFDAADD